MKSCISTVMLLSCKPWTCWSMILPPPTTLMLMMMMMMMWMCVLYSDRVNYVYLSVNDDDADVLHAVGIVAGSHLSVTSLRHDDGNQLSTHLVAAPWIKVQHTYALLSLLLFITGSIASANSADLG